MKKTILFLLCFLLAFSLFSCGNQEEEGEYSAQPPAFNVIRKQLKLTKHSEKSESATFSQSEFSDFLGESLNYITVTSLPEAEKGTLVFNGKTVVKGQSLPAEQLEFLKFVPNSETTEVQFIFTCDSKGYNGNELVCEIVFSEGINSPPVTFDSAIETVEGISCNGKLQINEPNGDEYTVNVITYPTDGYLKLNNDGKYTYIPNQGFNGKDKLVYTVTDKFGNSSGNGVLSITVKENTSGLYFADMQDNENHLYAHKMCSNNVMIYRYENGNYYFDPDSQVSKMDFLVMMMNVSGLDADITAVADSIVTDDSGLSSGLKGYLTAASEKGILKLDSGKFSPKEGITLADASYMIANALNLPHSGSVSASTDSLIDSVAAVMSAGIIEPVNGAVDISSVLTKSQTSELLYRIECYMFENNMKTNHSDD